MYYRVFRFRSQKNSRGKKLTIDAAIFKINMVIWLQAIYSRKPLRAVHKQLLL